MRIGDASTGLAAIVIGAGAALHAWGFPPASGQPLGPGALPAAIGVALLIVGALLVKAATFGISERDAVRPRPEIVSVPVFWRGALVLGSIVFYAIALPYLGFLITATLLLSVLFAGFGVRRTHLLPLAAAVTVAVHFTFYTLLRVPLPWGLLEAIAW